MRASGWLPETPDGERRGSGMGMREMSKREGLERGTGREKRPPRDAGGSFSSRLM